MEKTDIKSLNLEELTAFVESLGEKKFRQNRFTSGFTESMWHPFGDDQYFCGSH